MNTTTPLPVSLVANPSRQIDYVPLRDSFGTRLRTLRGYSTLENFANQLQISCATLISYESGECLPDVGVIYKALAARPSVSAAWLFYGAVSPLFYGQ